MSSNVDLSNGCSSTVSSIMNIQSQRRHRRNKVYEDIYSKVRKKIEHYVKYGQMSCTYDVPQIIYGAPNIDKTEITNYLEYRLKEKDGFGTYRLSPTSIYISWEEAIIREQEKINNKKKEFKNRELEMKKIEEQRNIDLLKSLSRDA